MVMREGWGMVPPELRMAERTRSFDSLTAASGRPTIIIEGIPARLTSTSTSTREPSRPTTAQLSTLARGIYYYSSPLMQTGNDPHSYEAGVRDYIRGGGGGSIEFPYKGSLVEIRNEFVTPFMQ